MDKPALGPSLDMTVCVWEQNNKKEKKDLKHALDGVRRCVLGLEASNVPDTNCLVKGGRDNEVISWMKRRTHDVVGVTSEHLGVKQKFSLVLRCKGRIKVVRVKYVTEVQVLDCQFQTRIV